MEINELKPLSKLEIKLTSTDEQEIVSQKIALLQLYESHMTYHVDYRAKEVLDKTGMEEEIRRCSWEMCLRSDCRGVFYTKRIVDSTWVMRITFTNGHCDIYFFLERECKRITAIIEEWILSSHYK